MKHTAKKSLFIAVIAFVFALQAHAGGPVIDTLKRCFKDVEVIDGDVTLTTHHGWSPFVFRTNNDDMTCIRLEGDQILTLPNGFGEADITSREVSFDFSRLESPDRSYRVIMRMGGCSRQGESVKYVSKLLIKDDSIEEIPISKSQSKGSENSYWRTLSTVRKREIMFILLSSSVCVMAVTFFIWLRRKLVARNGKRGS